MDTVATIAMAFSALRPTGNRIAAQGHCNVALPAIEGYVAHWVGSGTAALALALLAAKANVASGTEPQQYEVILPAYGCPDLVAAAHYAGLRAVLVDIQVDSPLYDYQQLQAAISPKTIAIVAATLLGIRADETPLRNIIGERPIVLIEDSAQWFPTNEHQKFFGDTVVVSFGRGKPVNLLGGGALLTKTELPNTVLRRIDQTEEACFQRAKQMLKRYAYNALIQPTVYGVVERAPFLHIGATKFHELQNIAAMAASTKALLPVNLQKYRTRTRSIQQRWKIALAALPTNCIIDLCAHHALAEDTDLLRYPLLINNATLRDDIYQRLHQQGLGASTMYGCSLISIDEVSRHAALFADDTNAVNFSARLLTLPTHDDVSAETIEQTIAIIRDSCTAHAARTFFTGRRNMQ